MAMCRRALSPTSTCIAQGCLQLQSGLGGKEQEVRAWVAPLQRVPLAPPPRRSPPVARAGRELGPPAAQALGRRPPGTGPTWPFGGLTLLQAPAGAPTHLAQQVCGAGEQARDVAVIQAAVAHHLLPAAPRGPGLHQPRQPEVHRDGRLHAVPDLQGAEGQAGWLELRCAAGPGARPCPLPPGLGWMLDQTGGHKLAGYRTAAAGPPDHAGAAAQQAAVRRGARRLCGRAGRACRAASACLVSSSSSTAAVTPSLAL